LGSVVLRALIDPLLNQVDLLGQEPFGGLAGCLTSRRGSPSVGEDTTTILSKLLSFTEPDIARLYDEKVVHRTEPFTVPQVADIDP
jgi:hypothetical protein